MGRGVRHGGRIVVDHLRAKGVERGFSVTGESFLAILDGLCDSGIANIVCRNEGAAAGIMARLCRGVSCGDRACA